MPMELTLALEDKLSEAAATEAFAEAVARYVQGLPQDRIRVARGGPPVKVVRLLTKVLEDLRDHPIDSISIEAMSGCSNYTGHALVQPGNLRIAFDWDCNWKAREAGLVSYGFPDQARAAREFGYDCFRRFECSTEG